MRSPRCKVRPKDGGWQGRILAYDQQNIRPVIDAKVGLIRRRDLGRRTIFQMEIGDRVLHPRYGVGVIDGIETRVQDGLQREYYVIPKPSLSSTIFVPVDSADEVGLRPVASQDTLEEALKIIAGESDDTGVALGLRNLSWNDPLDLARAIRHQLEEPKARYPKVSEQHQLKRAKKLLAEELSIVLGVTEDSLVPILNGEPARAGGTAVAKSA